MTPDESRHAVSRFALLAFVAIVGTFVALWLTLRPPAGTSDADPPTDPRLTFDTPYQNVRPDAKYAGDNACAACHADVAAHYSTHPMGRSMAPTPTLDEVFGEPFQLGPMRFLLSKRDGNVVHRQELIGTRGEVLASQAREAVIAIGSGQLGRSYLAIDDGFVQQSPISWFAERGGSWGISPGFSPERGFSRPVVAKCLFCHVNAVEPVVGTINRYEPPIFRGHSVGCERCHGPGQLHVDRQSSHEPYVGTDFTMVNPRRLTPELRESVCQQCHLQGEVSVLRRGREAFDFRPGLPIEMFTSTFVRIDELTEDFRAVGQVEQIHKSKCFIASAGEMGCISCHDPHHLPPKGTEAAYYRDKCNQCHAETPCRLPEPERLSRQADDSCIACHMKKADSTNIVHASVTDHRIPRVPPPRAARRKPLEAGTIPVRNFHSESPHVPPAERDRDLGIALVQLILDQGPAAQPLTRDARSLLTAAVTAFPDDFDAKMACGASMRLSRDPGAAIAQFDEILARTPDDEAALGEKAMCLEILRRPDEASAVWERLQRLNPNDARYPQAVASLHADAQRWADARKWIDTAIAVSPFAAELRFDRVRIARKQGDNETADMDATMWKRLRPKDAARVDR